MKKITRLRLGDRWWSVRWLDKVTDPHYPKEKLLGVCDFKTRQMKIDQTQSKKEITETLIHESLHAIFPFLDEDAVYTAAEELNEMLWATKLIQD